MNPCVLKCSALNKEGIKEIWHQIKILKEKEKTKSFQNNRTSQNYNWLWDSCIKMQ